LAAIAHEQSYAPLTVFRDVHTLPAKSIGLLFSLDALYVVILQFPFIRWVRERPAFLMMTVGMALTGAGLALFGLSFGVARSISPLLGGLVMDYLDPRWLWYISGILSAASAAAFLRLHRRDRLGRLATTVRGPG